MENSSFDDLNDGMAPCDLGLFSTELLLYSIVMINHLDLCSLRRRVRKHAHWKSMDFFIVCRKSELSLMASSDSADFIDSLRR